MRRVGRSLLKVERLEAVWLDSDGSMLPSRGVMKPPPSIAIGIMNSRGLFLIGWDEPVTVDCDIFAVVVVSDSESLVDCRDSEPDLKAKMQFSR